MFFVGGLVLCVWAVFFFERGFRRLNGLEGWVW